MLEQAIHPELLIGAQLQAFCEVLVIPPASRRPKLKAVPLSSGRVSPVGIRTATWKMVVPETGWPAGTTHAAAGTATRTSAWTAHAAAVAAPVLGIEASRKREQGCQQNPCRSLAMRKHQLATETVVGCAILRTDPRSS